MNPFLCLLHLSFFNPPIAYGNKFGVIFHLIRSDKNILIISSKKYHKHLMKTWSSKMKMCSRPLHIQCTFMNGDVQIMWSVIGILCLKHIEISLCIRVGNAKCAFFIHVSNNNYRRFFYLCSQCIHPFCAIRYSNALKMHMRPAHTSE